MNNTNQRMAIIVFFLLLLFLICTINQIEQDNIARTLCKQKELDLDYVQSIPNIIHPIIHCKEKINDNTIIETDN